MRQKCAVSGDSEFEMLSSYDYPLFCGCTDAPKSDDIIAKMSFAISKPSGVVQLKKLIPQELLYAHGHDAGAVGALWERHHAAFADFVRFKGFVEFKDFVRFEGFEKVKGFVRFDKLGNFKNLYKNAWIFKNLDENLSIHFLSNFISFQIGLLERKFMQIVKFRVIFVNFWQNR